MTTNWVKVLTSHDNAGRGSPDIVIEGDLDPRSGYLAYRIQAPSPDMQPLLLDDKRMAAVGVELMDIIIDAIDGRQDNGS